MLFSSPSTHTISSQSQGSDSTYQPFDSQEMEGDEDRLVNLYNLHSLLVLVPGSDLLVNWNKKK